MQEQMRRLEGDPFRALRDQPGDGRTIDVEQVCNLNLSFPPASIILIASFYWTGESLNRSLFQHGAFKLRETAEHLHHHAGHTAS
jgi:hypothetical protein